MNPEYLIKYYSGIKAFKDLISAIHKHVSKNIASEYSIWGNKIFIPFDDFRNMALKHAPFFDQDTLGTLYNPIVWNFCRSVYKFEDKIFQTLIESASSKVPMDSFLNLKEWAIYIDLKNKGLVVRGKQIMGSVLTITDASPSGKKLNKLSLNVILFLNTDSKRCSYTYLVPMISENINDCLEAALQDYAIAKEMGFDKSIIADSDERVDIIKKILNLYLYILCENKTIVNKNSMQYKYEKVKKRNHLFVPRDIKTWIIKADDKFKGEKDFCKTLSSVKPHVRRGHFHAYWKGPKHNPNDLIIKWIPPIYVNASKIMGNKSYV